MHAVMKQQAISQLLLLLYDHIVISYALTNKIQAKQESISAFSAPHHESKRSILQV